jgi:WD40 repeat protein
VFSPDGTVFATGGNENDQTAKIWDARSGTHMHTLRGHRWAVYCLAFSNDGSMLASGSGDATVLIWDVASGSLLSCLAPHDNYILRLEFADDGHNVISRTPEDTYTWDISSGHDSDPNSDSDSDSEEGAPRGILLNKRSEPNEGNPSHMAGVSDGYCFSMGDAHMVFMGKGGWEAARVVGAVQEEYRITGFAFHSDRVVFACTDGSVLILDVSRLKPWL